MENNPLFKENKLDKDSVLEYFKNKIAEKAYNKLIGLSEASKSKKEQHTYAYINSHNSYYSPSELAHTHIHKTKEAAMAVHKHHVKTNKYADDEDVGGEGWDPNHTVNKVKVHKDFWKHNKEGETHNYSKTIEHLRKTDAKYTHVAGHKIGKDTPGNPFHD